jgi:hypothetical protein
MDGMVSGENPVCLATIRGNACVRMDNASRAKCPQRSGCIGYPKFPKGIMTARSMTRTHAGLGATEAMDHLWDATGPSGSRPSPVALVLATR